MKLMIVFKKDFPNEMFMYNIIGEIHLYEYNKYFN